MIYIPFIYEVYFIFYLECNGHLRDATKPYCEICMEDHKKRFKANQIELRGFDALKIKSESKEEDI